MDYPHPCPPAAGPMDHSQVITLPTPVMELRQWVKARPLSPLRTFAPTSSLSSSVQNQIQEQTTPPRPRDPLWPCLASWPQIQSLSEERKPRQWQTDYPHYPHYRSCSYSFPAAASPACSTAPRCQAGTVSTPTSGRGTRPAVPREGPPAEEAGAECTLAPPCPSSPSPSEMRRIVRQGRESIHPHHHPARLDASKGTPSSGTRPRSGSWCSGTWRLASLPPLGAGASFDNPSPGMCIYPPGRACKVHGSDTPPRPARLLWPICHGGGGKCSRLWCNRPRTCKPPSGTPSSCSRLGGTPPDYCSRSSYRGAS
mmetsp:Transcript_866/g.2483  ORF Transcript_866/g.2483 Transcript_866/m.2483 type:complete len:312 (+) Transcript_866:560-1495(+)